MAILRIIIHEWMQQGPGMSRRIQNTGEFSNIFLCAYLYTHTCTACTPLRICIYIYIIHDIYEIYRYLKIVAYGICMYIYIYILYCVYICMYMYIYPKTCNPMLISFQRIPLSPPHKRELELRHHPDSAGRHG